MDIKDAKKLINECGLNIEAPVESTVLKIINDSLDRRIPAKLKVDNEGWLCCPCCDETFYLYSGDKRNSNCGKCGQALDWSYVDEYKKRQQTKIQ